MNDFESHLSNSARSCVSDDAPTGFRALVSPSDNASTSVKPTIMLLFGTGTVCESCGRFSHLYICFIYMVVTNCVYKLAKGIAFMGSSLAFNISKDFIMEEEMFQWVYLIHS